MNNIRISSLENYDSFKKVCKFFRLEDEYPGWTGDEKYGIIPDVCEDILLAKYPVIMQALSPYIILGAEYSEIRKQSINHDRRHERNQANYESLFALDAETEYHHDELACPDVADAFIKKQMIKDALSSLTDIQRSRIEKYFFQGMNYREIRESEGRTATIQAIAESIKNSLLKLKIFLS